VPGKRLKSPLLSLTEIQRDSDVWRRKNFPPSDRTAQLQLIGVVEEVGELSHHMLKAKQGIRGDTAHHEEHMQDAVGDILIYLCGLCSAMDWSIEVCVNMAWAQVLERDWRKHRYDGVGAVQETVKGTQAHVYPDTSRSEASGISEVFRAGHIAKPAHEDARSDSDVGTEGGAAGPDDSRTAEGQDS